jgi:hypothetical protein
VNSLAALQRRFQRHVLRPGRAMAGEILETPRAGAARRLSVYADGYRSRLLEALGNDYPALRALLGPDRFEILMRGYIESRPSRHPNLRWYGGALARYLGRGALADLAGFEWTIGLAFDAADAPLAMAEDAAAVATARWPAMRLALHPSVHTIELRSNAPAVWQALAGRAPPPRLAGRRPATWLVWRKDQAPYFRRMPVAEAAALALAARGGSFAAICRQVGRADRAALLLRNWLEEGLIAAVRAEGSVSGVRRT